LRASSAPFIGMKRCVGSNGENARSKMLRMPVATRAVAGRSLASEMSVAVGWTRTTAPDQGGTSGSPPSTPSSVELPLVT
jgi:hypothetical protein